MTHSFLWSKWLYNESWHTATSQLGSFDLAASFLPGCPVAFDIAKWQYVRPGRAANCVMMSAWSSCRRWALLIAFVTAKCVAAIYEDNGEAETSSQRLNKWAVGNHLLINMMSTNHVLFGDVLLCELHKYCDIKMLKECWITSRYQGQRQVITS